jgi:hypothetical protein
MKDEEPIIITEAIRDTLSPTISRLVAGLPMHKLYVIVKEAMACEDALEREIETLSGAVRGKRVVRKSLHHHRHR